MSNFMFDVKCVATVRVQAATEEDAVAALRTMAVDLNMEWEEPEQIVVRLVSLSADDGGPELVEDDNELEES